MNQLESLLARIGVVDETRPCKFTSDRYDVTFTVSTESHDVAYAVPIAEAELDALAELVRVERETPYVEDGDESLSETLDSVLNEGPIDAETWVERMAEPRRTVEPIVETWRELVTDEGGSGGSDDVGEASAGGDGGEASDEEDDDKADGGEDGSEAGEGDGGESSEGDDGRAEGDRSDEPAANAGDDGSKARGQETESETEARKGGRGGTDAWDRDAYVVYLPVGMESAVASFFDLCRRRNERESDPFSIPEGVEPATGLLARINAATDRPENRVVVNTRHLPPSRPS